MSVVYYQEKQRTKMKTRADKTKNIGAKFTSFRLIVVVQQKSIGSRNSLGGPRGETMGGNEVAFLYGF